MEPNTKGSFRTDSANDEVDLGQLLYKTGHVLKRVAAKFDRLVSQLGNVLLSLLFFLRKNLVWLIIGTLLGAGLGIFLGSRTGPRYNAEMLVKLNFGSSKTMFGTLDQFNTLTAARRHQELAELLNITPSEAATLLYFEASCIEDDTALNDYSISVTSSDPKIFSKIEQGIINQVSSNKLSQKIRTVQTATNKELEEILIKSIYSLDTLKMAYAKSITAGYDQLRTADSNMIRLSESGLLKHPELELYKTMHELIKELRTLREKSATETEIVEIYSSFGPYGKKQDFLKHNIIKYSIAGLLITFLILVCFKMPRQLKLEKKNSLTSKHV